MHDALPEPLGAKKHLPVRGISGNVSLWELWVKVHIIQYKPRRYADGGFGEAKWNGDAACS